MRSRTSHTWKVPLTKITALPEPADSTGTVAQMESDKAQKEGTIVSLANEKARLAIELSAQEVRTATLISEAQMWKRKADELSHEVEDLQVGRI